MKSILPALLFIGLVVFSGCKKDDDPVDPRDALVGTYDVTFDCFPDAGEVELEIEKDANDAKKILINSDVLDLMGVEDMEAEVSGNGFELEDTNFDFTDTDGTRYAGTISGDGEVTGKELEIDITLTGQGGGSLACDVEGEKQ